MADRIKGITIEIGGDTTGLNEALNGVNSEIRNTQSQLKDVERLLKLDPSNTELLKQKQKLLADAVGETRQKLETLKQAEQQAQEQFAKGKISEEQYNALKREIVATEQQLKSLEQAAGNSNVALQKIGEAGEKFQAVGEKIKGAGEKLLPVTGAVVGIGAAAVKTTADFDSSMSKVKAISGATSEEFGQLRDKAREMGAETKYSASEAADAFGYMAMAGWKTEDMLSGIEGIMNLAAASGEDLAATSDIVTDALTAFGMTAKDSGHFADILAAASSNANTNVGMMGESFKYVAPLAGTLGFSAEDVAVALGVMANSGIKASQAGTSLRSALTRLAKPTKEMGVVMDEFGISMFNSDGTAKSLGEIMDTLREEIGGCDESVQAYVATTLFGQEAMSGMLSIVNASEEDYKKLSRAVSDCDGRSKEMADTVQDNLAGQLTTLKSQLQEAAISIGDTLIPMIRSLVSKIQEWVDWYNNLNEGQKQTIVAVGLVVAAIGPLLIVIGQMSIGIGALMSAVSAIGPMLTALSASGGPLFLAALGVAGLASAFILAKDNANTYMEKTWELTDAEVENKEKVDGLLQSYADLSQKRQNALEDIDSQIGYEQELWSELQNITDANGKVKQGYEDRAAFITQTLSQALRTEIAMTDGIIDNYKDLQTEIDTLIEKKRQEALMNAYQAEYVQAVKDRKDAQQLLTEAVGNSQTATEEYNTALEKEKRLQGEYNRLIQEYAKDGTNDAIRQQLYDLQNQMIASGEATEGFRQTMETMNGNLENARMGWENINATIANYEGTSAAIISGDQQKIAESLLLLEYNFKTAENATKGSLQAQHQNIKTELANARLAMAQGAAEMDREYVSGLEQMELNARLELAKLAITAGESATDAAQAVKDKRAEMESAGTDYTAGFAVGIASGAQEVATAAGDVAQAGVDAAKTTLDSHSPSEVTKDIGSDFDSGLAIGISGSSGLVVESVNTVTNAAIGTLRTNLQASQTELSTFQSTTKVNWTTWANALVTEMRTSLNQVNIETSTNLSKMQTTFSTDTANIRKDWERQLQEMKKRHGEDMDSMNLKTTGSMIEMSETIKSQTEKMKTDALASMNDLVTGTGTALAQLEPTVRGGYEPAVRYITDLIPKARMWANDMMDGYIQGIREKIRELENACEDVADTVSDYMHFTRPEKGPLRYYEEWMPHMMQGFAKGIRDNKYLIENQMKDLTGSMSLMAQGSQAVRQPVIIRSYNQTILDGQVIAESVNDRLGAEL